ncbi:MAG TPA: TonB-dependent receptor [Phenylobacterium sp.]|uniref:TonB-dependent receptor n=1 Tax=Phenylobacterium sp. TaxID=1871053 RepID=UPI002F931C20
MMGLAAPALAQESAIAALSSVDSAIGLAEVVVTAEKRETNLQKTPISISVVTAAAMEDRHIYSLTDLNDGSAPGLRVMPYASRPYNMILNIRGVGIMSDTNQPAMDSGVGVYVDGVYLGRPQGLDAGLYDLESVEVLKGPQGTLFGRNTEAGALNIVTKKPTGQFGLNMVAGIGNYGSYESQFHLNLPEWHNLAVKLDGVVMAHDGWVKNPMVGQEDWNAVRRRGLRAQLRWAPTDNFTADYAYDTGITEDTGVYGYTVKAATGPGARPLAQATPLVGHRYDVAPVGVPNRFSPGEQSGHNLTLTWDVRPWLTLKSISSYRELYQEQWSQGGTDSLGAPRNQNERLFARYSLASFDQYQYSEEVQALGEAGRWTYIVGALAFHENVHDQAQAYYSMVWDDFAANGVSGYSASPIVYGAAGCIANCIAGQETSNRYGHPVTKLVIPLNPYIGVDRASKANTDSYGVYGQATYTPPIFNDIIHVTGGLRWTYDRKRGQLYVVNNYTPLQADGVTYAPINGSGSWKRVDPMINISVDVAENAMVYGKWARGYRSGGFNSRSITYSPFDPEEISMFEVGLKSEFFGHRARFNIAGYTGDYENVFYNISGNYYTYNADGTVNTQNPRTVEDTYNMDGKGKVSGVEADLQVMPIDGLTLSATYTYAHVRMPLFKDPLPRYVNVGGVTVPQFNDPTLYHQLYTPTNSATGAVDYKRDFMNYSLAAHLDASWNDGYYTSTGDIATGTDANGKTTYLPQLKTESGVIFNGRVSLGDIALADMGARMTVSFWVRNLFDAEIMTSRSGSYTRAASSVSGAFNDPRTYGVQASVKF